MAYKAIVDFKDLRTDHQYKAGDKYPFSGVVDEARAKQLCMPTTQRGALVVWVEDKPRKSKKKDA